MAIGVVRIQVNQQGIVHHSRNENRRETSSSLGLEKRSYRNPERVVVCEADFTRIGALCMKCI